MGRKSKKTKLTEKERTELEIGYKNSPNSHFSRRCHIILLKSEGYTSEQIANIFQLTIQPVNHWVKRYETSGIKGLQTKSGQGRKPILNKEQDEAKVRAVIKKERQRLKFVKEELEQDLNKEFSLLTLRRFLKNLSANGNESD
ncbi:MAG: helix-turn-helix domain-containing protein [Bacteroidetes bacterium]|nr:helix-turn-helix domain-containing protein [Bacteroidota bacterium]